MQEIKLGNQIGHENRKLIPVIMSKIESRAPYPRSPRIRPNYLVRGVLQGNKIDIKKYWGRPLKKNSMTVLYLTVNVFQCKTAVLYPEAESNWQTTELIKILNLSGVAAKLPHSYQYNDCVNLLLERLNIQQPVVYAISLKQEMRFSVLLNSQTYPAMFPCGW